MNRSPVAADVPQPTRASRRAMLLEVGVVYAVATGLAAALYRVRALDDWFHVLVAGLFLYLPVWVLRHHDLADYGLTTQPLRANLMLLALVVALVFPLFLVGFLAWQKLACATAALRPLAAANCHTAPFLAHWQLRLPPSLLTLDPRRNLLLAEVVVVALPEEFFFRGYLQTRLSQVWGAPWLRLWGAPVGTALVASAALFALSHLAVQQNPATLAVFFPGLVFGWLRARSGSVLPGTLFHALCNVYIDALGRSASG